MYIPTASINIFPFFLVFLDRLFEYFKKLGISTNQTEEKHEKVISSLTIEGIAEHISESQCKALRR